MTKNLAQLVTQTNAYKGLWKDAQLAQDIKMSLWAEYDPSDDLIYPTIDSWSDLLTETIKGDDYDVLTKDEVLSILFGLIHHTRIVSGSWETTFERGVMQKLLGRLLALDTDKH